MFRNLLISSSFNSTSIVSLPTHNNVVDTKSKNPKTPQPSTYQTKFVLIPENLEILTLLANNPPLVKQCNDNLIIQGEKCAVIISLIIKAYTRAEETNRLSYKGFANVCSKILRQYVRDYNEYITFLIDAGVIVSDYYYIPDEKSTGYKLTPEYINAPLKEYAIISHQGNSKFGAAIYSNISKITPDKKAFTDKYPELYQDLLSVTVMNKHDAKKYIYNELYIPAYKSVVKSLKRKRDGSYGLFCKLTEAQKNTYNIRKYNAWYSSIHDLDQKRVYFNQDQTSFRLHTSVIGVKSECRHFLRLYGKNIVSCDLKNSQPYLSAFFFTPGKINSDIYNILKNCLLDIKIAEPEMYRSIITRIRNFKKGDILTSTKLYINLVQSGQIYEFMSANVGLLRTIKRNRSISYDRNDGKNWIFKLFFNPINLAGYQNDIFRIRFPQVASLFEDINMLFTHSKSDKKRLKITDSGKNNLAILLQTIESHLVLNVICRDMKDKYPDIPLVTVHDAIATNPEYTDVLIDEMKTTLTAYIGIQPSIKEEDWSEPVLP